MSEENTPEIEETQVEAQSPEAEVAEEKPAENPLFTSLFDTVEAEEQEESEPTEAPSSLSEALYDIENEETQEVAEEVPEEKQPEPEVGEPPEAARPKKKSKKIKQVVDPEVKVDKPEETKVAFAEETEEQKILKELIPEEREYYDMAKFASDNMDDHKDLDKQFLDYFKKSKSYVEKRLKDDPYADLTDDFEYKEFVEKNRPQFSQVDAKRIERAMITKQAEEAAEAKVRPEVERLRREQEVARKKPEVDKKKAEYRQHFHKILPDDAQEVLAKEGAEALQKQNPIRYKVMDEITTNLLRFADAFQDITNGLTAYDETNQLHKELLDWVQQEQDHYINTGDTAKDGKTFMRRERYWAAPEDQRTQYFTWSDDDLMSLLVYRAKQRLEETLKYQDKMLTDAGYIRNNTHNTPAPAPKPAPIKQQESAPRVSPTPRGGQQVTTGNTPQQGQTPLSILGM